MFMFYYTLYLIMIDVLYYDIILLILFVMFSVLSSILYHLSNPLPLYPPLPLSPSLSTPSLLTLHFIVLFPSTGGDDDDKDEDGPDLGEEIQPDLDDIGVGVFPPEVGLTEPGTMSVPYIVS